MIAFTRCFFLFSFIFSLVYAFFVSALFLFLFWVIAFFPFAFVSVDGKRFKRKRKQKKKSNGKPNVLYDYMCVVISSALCFVLYQCFIWGRDHKSDVLQDVVEFEFKGDK